MGGEGWGEEKFIPRGWSTVKNKERDGGRGVRITLSFLTSPPPTPTVHSNCKSKMAGRTNNCELFSISAAGYSEGEN